jgi:hypothetical protein
VGGVTRPFPPPAGLVCMQIADTRVR